MLPYHARPTEQWRPDAVGFGTFQRPRLFATTLAHEMFTIPLAESFMPK